MERLLAFDASVSRWFIIPLESGWWRLARFVAHVGDGPYVFGGLGLVYLLAWGGQNFFLRRVTVMISVAVLASMLTVTLVKYIVKRQRPCPPGEFVTFKYDAYSFPSGHSARLTALAIGIGFFFPSFGWLVMVIALMVATARVAVGIHYVSDIVVGLTLGAIIAWGSIVFMQEFWLIPTS